MGITFNNAPKPIKAFFHSFSQVVLLENMISGLLILIAFFVAGLNSNDWAFGEFASWNLGIATIVAAIIGNGTAKLIGNDENAIASGLFGFNPVLVACAAATFFTGADVYIITVVGSILVTPLTTIINKLFARFDLAGATMPFIAMTWFIILVSFSSGLLNAVGRESALLASQGTSSGVLAFDIESLGALGWENVLTKGIGEIYLLDSVWASLIILVAFAWDRWHLAIKIVGVVIISIIIGMLFGVFLGDGGVTGLGLSDGVFTYCSILVLMGMETFSPSKKDNPMRYWLLVLLGIVAACLFQYAIGPVLGIFALPALTFPFCVALWGTLYFEKQLYYSK